MDSNQIYYFIFFIVVVNLIFNVIRFYFEIKKTRKEVEKNEK